MPSGRALAVAAEVCGAVAIGTTGVLAKIAVSSGLVVAVYRTWLCWLVIVIGQLVFGGRRSAAGGLKHAVAGGVLFGISTACFLTAVKYIPVATAVFIGTLLPVLALPIAALWLGDRPGRRQLASGIVAVGGIGVMVWANGVPRGGAALGNLLAIGALVSGTGYWLVSKVARDNGANAIDYFRRTLFVAALVLTAALLLLGRGARVPPPSDWPVVVAMAVASGVGQLLFVWSHVHVPVSVSSVLQLGVPAVSAILAWLVLHERMSDIQLLGALTALLALAVLAVSWPRDSRIGAAERAP